MTVFSGKRQFLSWPRVSMSCSIQVTKPSKLRDFKLLEQTSCGHCWRPLKVRKAWPGPRESQRPPYGNGRFLFVAQCGHIFHGACVTKSPKCKVCLAEIQDLCQVHYEEQNQPAEDQKQPAEHQAQGRVDNKSMEDLIGVVIDKIEGISKEIDRLRIQLSPKPKWR